VDLQVFYGKAGCGQGYYNSLQMILAMLLRQSWPIYVAYVDSINHNKALARWCECVRRTLEFV